MAKTNSWQCEKCGRVFNQDYQPGCCDNCGGFIFRKIATKSESVSSIFSSGHSFSDIILIGIGLILGRVIKSLFRYVMKSVKNSDKKE